MSHVQPLSPVDRAQKLYAGLAVIEKHATQEPIKQAARDLAMVVLDILADERARAKAEAEARAQAA